jgi:hypothetical protein
VQRRRFLLRGDAQLFVQQAHAFAVLAQGRCLLAGQGVETHERPVGRFVKIVQGQQAAGEGDGDVGFDRCFVIGDESFQSGSAETAVLLGLEETPVVEVWRIGQSEAGEEVAPVKIGGLGETGGVIAAGCGQEIVHIQPHVACEGDTLPRCVQPFAISQRAFQAGKLPTQCATSVLALRPEERGKGVPALLLTGHGQVHEQSQTFLSGKGDNFPVNFDPGWAEENEREFH